MPEAPDLSGKLIGRYRVLTLLGSGGMGAVYDAVDGALGRHVALKVLPPDLVSDASRLQRFVQEAKAASALNHPHVVSIYEIGSGQIDSRQFHFIAMEKVDGATLREILSREALPLRKALEVIAQVADAMGAAHSVGVVHRDLKPENIMVSSAGYAKVLDFGLAKLRADTTHGGDDDPTAVRSTETGVILGTAGYMSPEQARGKATDHRTDIFALGCILYEVVTGKRAFRGDSSVETLHKIIHSEPEPLGRAAPVVPAELHRMIRKALAKDADERYQSAKDLALDLRDLLRELGSPSSSQPIVPQSRPRRTSAVMIGLGTILILAAVVAIILGRRPAGARGTHGVAIQGITSKGNVVAARISPDGRFIAYQLREEGGQSLWLRQLASGQDLELVPRTTGSLWDCTFTPDGNAVVYGLKTPTDPRGAFYRVSTIGGRPERLLSGIDSAPSFSPDGKRMTWFRAEFPHPGDSALMVANSDGTGERIVTTRRRPELFVPIFFTRPSWSPDGKLIAAAVKRLENPVTAKLMGFDPDSGRETTLSNARWVALSALEWLPDQSGLIAVGANDAASADPMTLAGRQIWLIPYPSGERRSITNDVLGYREVSVSADGAKLVAVASDFSSQIWRVSLDGSRARQRISSGRYDGLPGISQMPDGRIVFSSIEGGSVTLSIVNADGSGRRKLTRDPNRNRYPVAFPRGIAYVSTTPSATEVCLTNDEGTDRRTLVRGVDEAAITVSEDGKWLVYLVDRRLWKISIGSGQRRQLTHEIASSPAYSPNGDRIAFVTGDPQEPEGSRLVVLHADGTGIVWSSSLLHGGTFQGTCLRWTRDGKALLLNDWDTHNVWMYPLAGEPKRLTNFDDVVWGFDISPDGKALVVAHGSLARDAVLITGFR